MGYTVGRIAAAAGVTVRTLHHYDAIGLLTPGNRADGGYRRYTDADLERLQQILFYRELGFPLDEIAEILDVPGADPVAHLRRQRGLLAVRAERLHRMIAAIDTAMEARRVGIDLTPEERFEVFGDHDPDAFAEEARRRWGGTEAYAESARRAENRTKADWQRLQDEAENLTCRYAEAMAAGTPATDPRVLDLAEEQRQGAIRDFYDCTPAMHRALAETYVADTRFTEYYESRAPGLARYVHDAIMANAARQE